jgi:hypothetical protein
MGWLIHRCAARRSWAAFFCTILFAHIIQAPLRAGFVGGVETFDGSTLDLSTWTAFVPYGGTVTQNNTVTVTSPAVGAPVTYTTRLATVHPGGWVEADITGITTGSASSLLLVDSNSQSVPQLAPNALELTYFGGPGYFDGFEVHSGSGDGVATDFAQAPQPRSYPLTLRIERPTASSVTFSVYNSSHTLLGSKNSSLSSSMPADMYVGLYSYAISTTFDNVRLGGNVTVPEPAAMSLMLLLPFALRRRRA